jgi:glyoxylase-like metal-dependent hydrolase (beta-lactamase superfamily II)
MLRFPSVSVSEHPSFHLVFNALTSGILTNVTLLRNVTALRKFDKSNSTKPQGTQTMFAMFRTLVFCLITFSATATAMTDDHFQVTTLAPDLLMLSTDQGSYSNNSLIFTGPDGVLLVDTQSTDDSGAFKAFVEGLGSGVPKYIINTHRHIEHIGGNHLFGTEPTVVAHQLFPEKLRSGTFLFAEYPPEAFPDLTFKDSIEITFNNEVIRLINIGGSHDDNEILVYFTKHGIAHTSSVVNGFNFPSVDGDGDVLKFEPLTRQLMTLLPRENKDAVVFLISSTEIYPESKYGYYTQYLAAKGLQKLGRTEEAIIEVRKSIQLKDDFEEAAILLDELAGA